MKENMIWLFLWCKRLIQKPLLLFTIFLMPCTVLFLQQCHSRQDAVLRVALYSETDTPEETTSDSLNKKSSSKSLLEHMVSLSNSSIYFYVCESKEQLLYDIKNKKANCGYLIPSDLDRELLTYVQDKKPFLTVVREKDDVTTKIVDEIVLSKNYQTIAYDMLENFLEQNTATEVDKEKLIKTFQSYCSNELLFQFEYLNGEKNALLHSKNTSILMLPLRGILAVILLLTCMAGGLLCFHDQLEGKYYRMTPKQKTLSTLYSIGIPGVAASLFALFSIKIAGISGGLLREIPAMLCYLFACFGLVVLLKNSLVKRSVYLASMPVILLLSLLLPPVFIDITNLFPGGGKLASLLPATWYLNSIQSPSHLAILLIYGGICLFLARFLRIITNLHQC